MFPWNTGTKRKGEKIFKKNLDIKTGIQNTKEQD